MRHQKMKLEDLVADITITLHSNEFNTSFDEVMGLKTFSSNAGFFEIIQFE